VAFGVTCAEANEVVAKMKTKIAEGLK